MKEVANSFLILEDKEPLLARLCDLFTDRGFRVYGAGSTAEARKFFQQDPCALDVLILDMQLQETVTGADFGIEVRQSCREWPPEFLIYSAHMDHAEYLRLALKLGVASYLEKTPDSTQLLRHVRALSLRRALRADRPGLPEEIARIAVKSQSKAEAVDRFCSEILYPELERVLGMHFLILISDEAGGRCIDSYHQKWVTAKIYQDLQDRVFDNPASPVVDCAKILPGASEEAESALTTVAANPGSVFIPLAAIDGVRVALGLIQETVQDRPLPENAQELAAVLVQYLHFTLLNNMIQLTRLWTESDKARRKQLQDASSYCLYVGQEVIQLFEEARRDGAIQGDERSAPLWYLRSLGEELRAAGELLGPLGRQESLADENAPKPQAIDAGPLLNSVWDELVEEERVSDAELLHVEGSCKVWGREDYLRMAFSRLLLWLARRQIETPDGETPGVFVKCEPREGRNVIRFEDRSRRLPAKPRERLFVPFSAPLIEPMTGVRDHGRRLGLFLAKALVEADGGQLKDCSDELPGDSGHCFEVSLPPVQETDAPTCN